MELDFTSLKINPMKMYGGANGNKLGIIYQGSNYMLKFPPKPTRNNELIYTNSCISEYVACKIFKTLGIDTQETLLGLYKNKITVACKDFETDGYILKDFAHLKNTILDSEHNGYGTELSDILKTIKEQNLLPSAELNKFFWEMFIGDALLGNFDRHNGNWGFLINENSGNVKIAPVYDCGSCLFPQMDEKTMKNVLNEPKEIENRVFVYPTSAIQFENKKINYAQFLMTTDNKECLAALENVHAKIEMDKIQEVIHNTPFISDLQKQFFYTIIAARKEKIIDKAMDNNAFSCDNMLRLAAKKNIDKLEKRDFNVETKKAVTNKTNKQK